MINLFFSQLCKAMLKLFPSIKDKHINFVYRYFISIIIFASLYYISHYYIEQQISFKDDLLHKKKDFSFWQFLYFSLGTQSFIGYGDFVPTHAITKFITALQIFTAVMIATTII